MIKNLCEANSGRGSTLDMPKILGKIMEEA